tara:strand:+ start:288 stop:587 length:300 start_codon:yes stop_codon:yes gene_type:complete
MSSATQYASASMSGGMDPVLSWVGGVAMISGIIALVLTRGAIGIRAVVIGLICLLLNQAIARYSDWLFLPVLIATGAVSLTYGYRTIKQVLRHRKGDVS